MEYLIHTDTQEAFGNSYQKVASYMGWEPGSYGAMAFLIAIDVLYTRNILLGFDHAKNKQAVLAQALYTALFFSYQHSNTDNDEKLRLVFLYLKISESDQNVYTSILNQNLPLVYGYVEAYLNCQEGRISQTELFRHLQSLVNRPQKMTRREYID